MNSLAAYKNRPAIVRESAGDKIHIELADGQLVKVREKDVEPIHPGPVKDFSFLDDLPAEGREAWDLLEGENGTLSLRELADLAFGAYTPASAWAAFSLLVDGLYFSGTIAAIVPEKRANVEAEEKKRREKQRETGEREQFLQRMRMRIKNPAGKDTPDIAPDIPVDSRFIQDVEALALGKSAKSKTMKDLGLSETPEDAHALLLNTGFWTERVNPHPPRFGLSLTGAKTALDPPPDEQRRDLTRLASFAIDNPWSNDPDDAVSIEESGGKRILYVHVADPAASIGPDSLTEREARDRGATLYLPEGSFSMLTDTALPLFALGLAEKSPALTFRMVIGDEGEIEDTEIFPSIVKVRRLTYGEADQFMDDVSGNDDLRGLNALAERNMKRRAAAGAVNIDLPEVRIGFSQGQPVIEPVLSYRSSGMVRECMLLAGEGAGMWAEGRLNTGFAFPFVSQEAGDIPAEIPDGFAGSYQLRRCMRPRTLSPRPGPHWGLGLDVYSQVTSPLRRYTDLLAHLQIRALLRGGGPLSSGEVSSRLGAAEAAAQAAAQAERASKLHWTLVYLSGKKDSIWDAAALEKKGNRWVVIIPALALETQVPLRKDIAPNDTVKLALKSVNIPRGEAVFVEQ